MALPSISWDDVADRYRAFDRQFARMRPTTGAMLRLVAVLQHDPRFDPIARNVSHTNLCLTKGGPRSVSVNWSEPDGMAWAGQVGFVIYFVELAELDTFDHIVVSESEVVEKLVEYLSRL